MSDDPSVVSSSTPDLDEPSPSWSAELQTRIYMALNDTPLGPGASTDWPPLLHLAVMTEPHMGRVENGEKTAESRWSVNVIAPYRAIGVGHVVAFKPSGKPNALGAARVRMVLSGELPTDAQRRREEVSLLLEAHGAALGFQSREEAESYRIAAKLDERRYVTILMLDAFIRFDVPIPVRQPGRAGWICLHAADLARQRRARERLRGEFGVLVRQSTQWKGE